MQLDDQLTHAGKSLSVVLLQHQGSLGPVGNQAPLLQGSLGFPRVAWAGWGAAWLPCNVQSKHITFKRQYLYKVPWLLGAGLRAEAAK